MAFLAAAPNIDIHCSFWDSFSFTPELPSDETICITRMAQSIYILSYTKGHTRQKEFQVTSILDGWKVEEIICTPTSFAHHHLIETVTKTQTIQDKAHYLSLTPVRLGVKVAECMVVCGLLFIALFTGHQICHRKYSWRVVAMSVPSLLLVASLILSRNNFRKNRAFWNSIKLITVVDYARQNKASIEERSLVHLPSQYK